MTLDHPQSFCQFYHSTVHCTKVSITVPSTLEIWQPSDQTSKGVE